VKNIFQQYFLKFGRNYIYFQISAKAGQFSDLTIFLQFRFSKIFWPRRQQERKFHWTFLAVINFTCNTLAMVTDHECNIWYLKFTSTINSNLEVHSLNLLLLKFRIQGRNELRRGVLIQQNQRQWFNNNRHFSNKLIKRIWIIGVYLHQLIFLSFFFIGSSRSQRRVGTSHPSFVASEIGGANFAGKTGGTHWTSQGLGSSRRRYQVIGAIC